MLKADFKRILSSWQFYMALVDGLTLFMHPVFLASNI